MFKKDGKHLTFILKTPRCPNELANMICAVAWGTYPGNMAEVLCHFC